MNNKILDLIINLIQTIVFKDYNYIIKDRIFL
jgi:hypothetical protein